jgi:hypothetical protein
LQRPAANSAASMKPVRCLSRLASFGSADFDLHVRQRPPWLRPEDHEHMLDGLRNAGWQG